MGMSTVRKHKLLTSLSFEPLHSVHCLAALDLWAGLGRQSIVSSSRMVRACNPWGGRWIGHVWSSAPHSQTVEAAIPNLCKQEQKGPTPVRRRLSQTHDVSDTARNFVQGGSITVRPIVPSVSFRTIENWHKAPVKILSSLFRKGQWPLRRHSGFATARCSWQCHSRRAGRGWKHGVS